MSEQWNTPIDKLMIWRLNNWSKYDAKFSRLTLRINFDQLMITSESKVLESFNMNSKIKGIYKEDVLILVVSAISQQIRKLKFQLKGDVMKCLHKLGEHFPVMNHNSIQPKNNVIQSKYRDIEGVLRDAMEKTGPTTPVSLPVSYGNFIKMCLLDPTFPEIVLETEKMLKKISIKQ